MEKAGVGAGKHNVGDGCGGLLGAEWRMVWRLEIYFLTDAVSAMMRGLR